MATIQNVRFEHYRPENSIGVHETKPRISWTYQSEKPFNQEKYQIEVSEIKSTGESQILGTQTIVSTDSRLVPWPLEKPLQSRQRISIRVQAVSKDGDSTPWSEPAVFEAGLLTAKDWHLQRIAGPKTDPETPQPEQLFRKAFEIGSEIASARLYITAQGIYEAEVNGEKVGDYFLAPGWTEYNDRLQYQTYDVTKSLCTGKNCIGVRVAEGWYNGRLGFHGGRRNLWGDWNTLLVQLEITLKDGTTNTVVTDGTWKVTTGPIQLAEIYDGEKYDATKEVDGWSSVTDVQDKDDKIWSSVEVLDPLSESTELIAGYAEPARRVDIVKPVELITTPTGKKILDFNQNLVGYLRIKNVRGPPGHKITLSHAEVLENGELGIRPLRVCKATDEYTLKGSPDGESWEPRFTFHGFRYAQIDNWPEDVDLMESIEAVVCHTDMQRSGHFECSDPMLNKLYENVVWSMKGNFLSVPTDCPQRDERLGWTGDLALFAPTAAYIYNCAGILKNWLRDFAVVQQRKGGLPAMVVPDVLAGSPIFDLGIPCAIWHDVAVLGPWAVYAATGDVEVLRTQWTSMKQWIEQVKRHIGSQTPNLWDPSNHQLGDWLDPAAPPDAPWKSATDAKLVADAFLIQTLRLISIIASLIGEDAESTTLHTDFTAARDQFQAEWTTPNGRVICESQTAYALAICFDLLTPSQRPFAGARLAHIVRAAEFKIGTGFAGTPFVCEALAQTGHVQVAYAMLLNQSCPSWLYPISMGATTTWERWDSMLPDGSINPGEMTSFNHYAFGAVATFLHERIAGLKCIEPGWRKVRVEPLLGAEFTWARASHETPFGKVGVKWEVEGEAFRVSVEVPEGVEVELVVPEGEGTRREVFGKGEWRVETVWKKGFEWPVEPVKTKLW